MCKNCSASLNLQSVYPEFIDETREKRPKCLAGPSPGFLSSLPHVSILAPYQVMHSVMGSICCPLFLSVCRGDQRLQIYLPQFKRKSLLYCPSKLRFYVNPSQAQGRMGPNFYVPTDFLCALNCTCFKMEVVPVCSQHCTTHTKAKSHSRKHCLKDCFGGQKLMPGHPSTVVLSLFSRDIFISHVSYKEIKK